MEQLEAKQQLEERIELSLLYDFYGALLKENQRRMFEAWILDDYGYTEIAEEEGISRQGVYDAIKRATKQLKEYEDKLGLVERFEKQRVQIKELRERLIKQDLPYNQEIRGIFDLMEAMLEE